MTEQEFRDVRLVWHCKNRHNDTCKQNHFCRGTACKTYCGNPGSYHDVIEPIIGGKLKHKQERKYNG